MSWEHDIECLALEGGGVKAMSYIPILERLDGSPIRHVAGTSAGALYALALALGADSSYIKDLMWATDWSGFTKGRAWYRWPRLFWPRSGIFANKIARIWVEERLDDFGFPPETTLGEIERSEGIRLSVATSNHSWDRPTLWDSRETPDAPAVDVIVASMSIQFFFPLVKIWSDWHGDGGLTWNHPIDIFNGEDPEIILGIRVDNPLEGKIRNHLRHPIAMIISVINLAQSAANQAHVDEVLWERVIQVHTEISGTEFNITEEGKEQLLRDGKAGLRRWEDGRAAAGPPSR